MPSDKRWRRLLVASSCLLVFALVNEKRNDVGAGGSQVKRQEGSHREGHKSQPTPQAEPQTPLSGLTGAHEEDSIRDGQPFSGWMLWRRSHTTDADFEPVMQREYQVRRPILGLIQ